MHSHPVANCPAFRSIPSAPHANSRYVVREANIPTLPGTMWMVEEKAGWNVWPQKLISENSSDYHTCKTVNRRSSSSLCPVKTEFSPARNKRNNTAYTVTNYHKGSGFYLVNESGMFDKAWIQHCNCYLEIWSGAFSIKVGKYRFPICSYMNNTLSCANLFM